MPTINLVVISTINQDHGAIVEASLKAGKHVVVEYPLCLDLSQAEALLALATAQGKLLHVEHIELLGGVHQALKESIASVGQVFFARYATIKPDRPAPQRWTYHGQEFGFPLIGALSRLHRLVDLFGKVSSVTCGAKFWAGDRSPIFQTPTGYFTTCLCIAQLQFASGVMAEVTYGKGEALWQDVRLFEVSGEKGALILDGDEGQWIHAEGSQPLTIGARRGLFIKDTTIVLDHLMDGAPLYVTAADSVYTLKVADATRRSAEQGGMAIPVDEA